MKKFVSKVWVLTSGIAGSNFPHTKVYSTKEKAMHAAWFPEYKWDDYGDNLRRKRPNSAKPEITMVESILARRIMM